MNGSRGAKSPVIPFGAKHDNLRIDASSLCAEQRCTISRTHNAKPLVASEKANQGFPKKPISSDNKYSLHYWKLTQKTIPNEKGSNLPPRGHEERKLS